MGPGRARPPTKELIGPGGVRGQAAPAASEGSRSGCAASCAQVASSTRGVSTFPMRSVRTLGVGEDGPDDPTPGAGEAHAVNHTAVARTSLSTPIDADTPR